MYNGVWCNIQQWLFEPAHIGMMIACAQHFKFCVVFRYNCVFGKLCVCVCAVCIHHMVTYIHTGIEWRRWRRGDVILILESIQLHRIALNNDDDDSEIFISDCIWHRSRIYMDLHDDLSCGTDSFFLLIIRISSVDSTKRIEMYSLAEFNGSKSRRTKDGRYWRNVCVWGRMAQLFE